MNSTVVHVLNRFDEARKNSGNPTWNISRETGLFLHTLIRAMNARRVLEIGTSTGYSGLYLAEALTHTGGTLVTIESHAERFAIAKETFAVAGLQNIEQIQGHAPEVLPGITGIFDILFFDATKEEHLSYFKTLDSKLRVNGLIITDNIISHAKELQGYKEYLEAQSNYQHTVVPIGTGLLVSLKIS